MPEDPEFAVQIPIEWHYPENTISRFATNMIVQNREYDFLVSFFEIIPPVALGSPEDQLEQLKGIESVRAECVARIVIAADRMPSFIEALQSNLDKYQATRTKSDDQD